MRRILLDNKEALEISVREAVSILKQGGLILYPTDTLYGIGADALNEEAVKKVYKLKGRDFNKPLSVIVSDSDMAREYVNVSSFAEKMMKKILPGPFTLVLPRLKTAPDVLVAGGDTLGIRIPDSEFCHELAKAFGRPITTTSANVSEQKNEHTIDSILEQFGENSGLVDCVIDAGALHSGKGSTILEIVDDTVHILREGSVNSYGREASTKKRSKW